MKTIYTLTVDIPNKAGVLSRRTMYFGKLKDRQEVYDHVRAKGYRVSTNIEHVYTPKEGVDAVCVEERFFSAWGAA